ncbi:MAG: hypothetical protein ACK5HR_01775 [Mycoplasmatales bacterium]
MRRFLLITIVFVLFCLFFTVVLMAESNYEYSRNRVLLINNIENSNIVKDNNINIKGDYLVGFNGIDNIFNMIYLNQSLTLFDEQDKEFASYAYYLAQDYDKFLNILGELYDEPIVDYINFANGNDIKTNIDKSQQDKYQETLEVIFDINATVQGDGNFYNVDYNNEWLRLFESFSIDTGKLMNKDIINKNIKEIKETELYQQKFLSTFFKIYVPYIECTADYCKYNENNIDKIEELFNKNLKMKIDYNFLNIKDYTKIDEQLDEEEINAIESENEEQESNSNTHAEVSQEADSDGDGILDASDPYPQDPYNNELNDSTDDDTNIDDNTNNTSDNTDSGGEEILNPDTGGDTTDPDTGGDITDPDTGGDTTDPDTGGDTTDPDTGGDTTDPDTGGDTTDPDTGGDTTDPDTGGDTTDPDELIPFRSSRRWKWKIR